MKTRFKGLMALAPGMALSLALAGFAGAQDQPAPPQGEGQHEGMRGPGRGMPSPEERLKHLTEALNLTTDQQGKIKELMAAEKSGMDKLRDDTSLSNDERREKAMHLRKESQAAIRAQLTADQQTKFDKMQAEMKNRGEHHGPPPPNN